MNIKINTRQFLTIGIYNTCTCEITHGREYQTPKPKRQSWKPSHWAIRKCML